MSATVTALHGMKLCVECQTVIAVASIHGRLVCAGCFEEVSRATAKVPETPAEMPMLSVDQLLTIVLGSNESA